MRWNRTRRAFTALLGTLIVCGALAQNRIPVWNIALHFRPSSMAFQSDGRHLVLMGSKVLAIYDTASERVSRVFGPKDFEQGGDLRLNVFVGTNGDMVVLFGVRSHNQTRVFAVYTINTKRLVRVIESPASNFVSLSPSGNWIALCQVVSSTETILQLINLPQQSVYSYRYLNLYQPVQDVGLGYPKVLFTSDDRRAVIVTASASSTPPKAELIRLADGAIESEILFGDSETLPHSLQLAPSGRYLAVYGWSRRATTASGAFVVDLQNSTVQTLFARRFNTYNFPTGLAWVSDQMLFIGDGTGFAVYVQGIFNRHISIGGYPQQLLVQPHTNRVVASHVFGVCIVDWSSLSAQVYPTASPTAWTSYGSARFSPNRAWMVVPKWLVSLGWHLSLLRTSDFTEARLIPVSTRMEPLAVSNDGQRVVASSGSGASARTHLLDLTTGQEIWTLPYAASQALFLPDGSGVLVYAGSNLIRIRNDGSEAWRQAFGLFTTLVSVSDDGKVIALNRLGAQGQVLSLDLETLEVRTLYQGRDLLQVVTTPNHQYIAVVQQLGELRRIIVFRYPTMQQVGVLLVENVSQEGYGTFYISPVLLDSAGLGNEFHAYALGMVYVISAETARVLRRVPLQDSFAFDRGFWCTPSGWVTLRRNDRYFDYDMVYHPANDPSPTITPISYRASSPQFASVNEVVFGGFFGANNFGRILWRVDAKPSEFHRFVIASPLQNPLVVGGGFFLEVFEGTWLAGEWPSLRVLAEGRASRTNFVSGRPELVVVDTQLYNWTTGTYLWDVNSTGLSGILSFRFSPDANLCYIWLSSGVRWMYDVQTNTPLWRTSTIGTTAQFSRDSRYILLDDVFLLDARTGSSTRLDHTVYLDGRFAVTHTRLESGNMLTRLIEIPSRRTVAIFETPQPLENIQVAASPEDRWFIITSLDYSLVYPNPYGRTAGDTNFDGCVDEADLLAVLFSFGRSGGWEDLNSDGVVEDADLLIILSNFGNGC